MALKDLEVRALKARDRVYKLGDGYGLYIEVHPNGSKLWRLKYSHLGKDKRIAFGRYLPAGSLRNLDHLIFSRMSRPLAIASAA